MSTIFLNFFEFFKAYESNLFKAFKTRPFNHILNRKNGHIFINK